MSIQLPDGTAIGNWSPGWEKNLPKWYTEGYESGLFNQSNNWGGDFFPQYRGGKKIPAVIPGGSSMVPGYPSRQTSPSLGNRIEDFLSTLPKAPGLPGKRRIPYYDDNWNAGGSQVNEAPGRTNPEDWIMDGPAPAPGPARIDDTPPMQTPPADVPTPPLEKTLEQRVWERDQMPARTPDAQGRLYPDKKDPGFIDR